MDNEVGLTHLRLASGFYMLGGNNENENARMTKIWIWKREGENPKSILSEVSVCSCLQKKYFALMFLCISG